jgi:hypothetical protein
MGQGIVSPLITCGTDPSWAITAAGTAINKSNITTIMVVFFIVYSPSLDVYKTSEVLI